MCVYVCLKTFISLCIIIEPDHYLDIDFLSYTVEGVTREAGNAQSSGTPGYTSYVKALNCIGCLMTILKFNYCCHVAYD